MFVELMEFEIEHGRTDNVIVNSDNVIRLYRGWVQEQNYDVADGLTKIVFNNEKEIFVLGVPHVVAQKLGKYSC